MKNILWCSFKIQMMNQREALFDKKSQLRFVTISVKLNR